MKLIFPNGEHEPVEVELEATVLVGRGDDTDVSLEVDGVAARHALIQRTRQGAWISVENAANITRVNGALVVARTPVKGGDALLFGPVQCQVAGALPVAAPGVAERASPEPEPAAARATAVRQAVPRFLLRGVSGSTFGKHFPLHGTTVIGRHSECDVCLPSDEISRRHARVTVTSEGVVVEDLDSANGTFVNGKRIHREVIEPGDELKLDTVRFLVQSTSGETPSRRRQPAPPPPAAAPTRSGAGKWVAIVVVVLLASAVGLKVAGLY